MLKATRLAALAAVAALAFAGPAFAQGSAGAPPGVTYILDRGVTSNRIATARMYVELTDAANKLRHQVEVGDRASAETSVNALRARIDRMQASPVVDPKARLMIAELRPHAVSMERDLKAGKAVSVRTVDKLIAQIERTNAELLQAGLMERMGGGAGRGMPKLPEVRIYPPGTGPEAVPPAPRPETLPANPPPPVSPSLEERNNQPAPGNERNQIEDWRGDDQD